jgi:hypothetical protein
LTASHPTWRSDASLKHLFLTHRVEYEKIVAMAQEDVHVVRVTPDFTWLDDDAAWPRKNVGISSERWNQYRDLFHQVDSREGFIKQISPLNISFPIISAGLVPAGWTKGIVYSPDPLSPLVDSLDKKAPDRLWKGSTVVAYKSLEDGWYIYYKQW